MSKVLIFSAFNDVSALECAIKEVNSGNEVHVIQCDKQMRICMHNMYGSSTFCELCHHAMMTAWKESGINDRITIKSFRELLAADDKLNAQKFEVSFDSVLGLKTLKYKGAEVGFGAFSSYVSMTRNVMPDITDDFKKFIAFLIRREIEMYDVAERYAKQIEVDKIIFHNGRFSNYKPFLALSQNLHVNYLVTEHDYCDGKVMSHFVENNNVHEIEPCIKLMKENWEIGKTREDAEYLGKMFYERRRKGKAAGDVVYTKNQQKGLMPDNWDETKENIAIFNSSEDEFCAVSSQFDSYTLFPTQYDALKAIFEHYKNDTTKHFYVRIHPNLKNVPFKSHLGLYELKYPNVTFIRPESPISSYDLMDGASKVLIFNSTMGVEATYWGKPVIALTYFYYSAFDAVHTPKNVDELWTMIDNKNLECKYNHDVIKYGYWLYRVNYPEFKYAKYKIMDFKFLGRRIHGVNIMKFLGCYKIVPILEMAIRKLTWLLPTTVISKFPATEPYQVK